MKIISIVLIGILPILGCQENNNHKSATDDIKVGMTYDEVESLLGKPTAIERGVNELEFSDENKTSGLYDLYFMYRDSAILHDPQVWLFPPKLNKIGSMIYVAWVYLKNVRIDTFYVLVPKYKTISKRLQEAKYYQFSNSNIKWSESEFKKLSPSEKKTYGEYRMYGGGWYNKKEEIISGYEKKCQPVLMVKTILFDAASGRVVNDIYQPSSLQ